MKYHLFRCFSSRANTQDGFKFFYHYGIAVSLLPSKFRSCMLELIAGWEEEGLNCGLNLVTDIYNRVINPESQHALSLRQTP